MKTVFAISVQILLSNLAFFWDEARRNDRSMRTTIIQNLSAVGVLSFFAVIKYSWNAFAVNAAIEQPIWEKAALAAFGFSLFFYILFWHLLFSSPLAKMRWKSMNRKKSSVIYLGIPLGALVIGYVVAERISGTYALVIWTASAMAGMVVLMKTTAPRKDDVLRIGN